MSSCLGTRLLSSRNEFATRSIYVARIHEIYFKLLAGERANTLIDIFNFLGARISQVLSEFFVRLLASADAGCEAIGERSEASFLELAKRLTPRLHLHRLPTALGT